mmetsp:Transcript_8258/g.24928  ORF Transcript_8258/g.24928 Transcript_8258/m.24928 type:complete len:220 (+) Transcript_8258:3416-4075(+)
MPGKNRTVPAERVVNALTGAPPLHAVRGSACDLSGGMALESCRSEHEAARSESAPHSELADERRRDPGNSRMPPKDAPDGARDMARESDRAALPALRPTGGCGCSAASRTMDSRSARATPDIAADGTAAVCCMYMLPVRLARGKGMLPGGGNRTLPGGGRGMLLEGGNSVLPGSGNVVPPGGSSDALLALSPPKPPPPLPGPAPSRAERAAALTAARRI